jgi:hypothetical protein
MARAGDTVVSTDGRAVGKVIEKQPHAIVADVGGRIVCWKLKGRANYAAALPDGHHRLMR